MHNYKNILILASVISVLTACTTPYSNKELRDMFNAKGLQTEEREQGVVIFLPGVFFEVGKADLTPPAQLKVSEIASVVNDPHAIERSLLLEGHADSSGTDEYNMELSERRAQSVYQSMIAGKVRAERMKPRGFGEKYPIADNMLPNGSPNPEGQAKNRRVEVILKNPEK